MEQSDVWNKLYGGRLTWNKETIDLPHILKGKKVLELGVGNGKTLKAILKQKPKEVYAVDFSDKAIERSMERFGDKVKLMKEDARKIPFDEEFFDAVVCYYVLNNNLKKDREKIVAEIYRVLKRGGECLFEDFSVNDLRNKGKSHITEKNTIVKKDRLICHFFNEDELNELFGDFKIKLEKKSFYPIRGAKFIREIIRISALKK